MERGSGQRSSERRDDTEGISCEIVLRGELGPEWTEWFEGLQVKAKAKGETLLSGVIADQAALHGLLRKIRDLGLPLISLTCDPAAGTAKGEDGDESDTL